MENILSPEQWYTSDKCNDSKIIQKPIKFAKEYSIYYHTQKNKEIVKEIVINILIADFDNLLTDRKIGTGPALVSLINEFDKKLNAVNVRLYRKFKTYIFKKDGFSSVLSVLAPNIYKDYLEYK